MKDAPDMPKHILSLWHTLPAGEREWILIMVALLALQCVMGLICRHCERKHPLPWERRPS